ncbi:MAG: hypothetical protein QGD96_10525 [Anaerolineae bacterium]|nr:hypothetical protein [Anaerolineae bacterium]
MNPFWINFWSNLLSGLIIVSTLGIFLNWRLNILLLDRADKTESRKLKEESHQRKKKILALLDHELYLNTECITNFSNSQSKDSEILDATIRFAYGLTTENWRAFSDGGELKWINDVALLSMLATAYHHIQMVKDIAKLFLRYRWFDPPATGTPAVEHLKIQLDTRIDETKNLIEGAKKLIETT